MEENLKKKTTADKVLATAVIALITTVLATFLIFIYTFYNAYKGKHETNSLIKNQVTIPKNATDLTIVGENWYTFKFEGYTVLFHKKVAHLNGSSAESMTTLPNKN